MRFLFFLFILLFLLAGAVQAAKIFSYPFFKDNMLNADIILEEY